MLNIMSLVGDNMKSTEFIYEKEKQVYSDYAVLTWEEPTRKQFAVKVISREGNKHWTIDPSTNKISTPGHRAFPGGGKEFDIWVDNIPSKAQASEIARNWENKMKKKGWTKVVTYKQLDGDEEKQAADREYGRVARDVFTDHGWFKKDPITNKSKAIERLAPLRKEYGKEFDDDFDRRYGDFVKKYGVTV